MTSSLGQPVYEGKPLNVPDTNFAAADWSQFDGKRFSKEAMGVQLFSYTLYDFDGRNLDRVEVTAMMRMIFYGDRYYIKHGLFNKFEDPESNVRIAYHNMDDTSKQAWWTRIDFWFTELRRTNPVIQARADALRGL